MTGAGVTCFFDFTGSTFSTFFYEVATLVYCWDFWAALGVKRMFYSGTSSFLTCFFDLTSFFYAFSMGSTLTWIAGFFESKSGFLDPCLTCFVSFCSFLASAFWSLFFKGDFCSASYFTWALATLVFLGSIEASDILFSVSFETFLTAEGEITKLYPDLALESLGSSLTTFSTFVGFTYLTGNFS